MIDAIISGKLHGQPQQRTSSNGKPYATAKVRAATGGGESLFVNVIAFSDTVQAALLVLDEGESIALSGELTPRVWIDRQGNARPSLDLLAHAALTAYHVKRKRAAMTEQADHGGNPI